MNERFAIKERILNMLTNLSELSSEGEGISLILRTFKIFQGMQYYRQLKERFNDMRERFYQKRRASTENLRISLPFVHIITKLSV